MNKASGADGTPVELLELLKDDAVKVLTTYVSKFGKLSSGPRTEVSFHDNPKEGQSQNCSNYHTIVLISHTNKVMLKILQFRLQQSMNRELPDGLGLRKGRGTRD